MTLIVPNSGEAVLLALALSEDVILKLYSNDVTPGENSVVSDFTEVAGAGYAAKTLSSDAWNIVTGDPSVASYAYQDFQFTGPTTAPSTVYGYFVVNAAGVLLWAERFNELVVPFSPVIGTVVRITPKLSMS